LLDEVLGVGDASFEERSREKLDELMSRAQAVVVVSHHPAFRGIATNGLWLERGGLSALGDLEASTEEYIAEVRKAHEPMKAAA
jgi:ABC-2 type transport system ATP-binding protein/lipopolysaccharide transport system ATP-binding protein